MNQDKTTGKCSWTACPDPTQQTQNPQTGACTYIACPGDQVRVDGTCKAFCTVYPKDLTCQPPSIKKTDGGGNEEPGIQVPGILLAAAPPTPPLAEQPKVVVPATGGALTEPTLLEGTLVSEPAVASVEILIPVTGVELPSRSMPLFGLSSAFLGLGLVLQGLSKKRK